jgi:hypothetical protein
VALLNPTLLNLLTDKINTMYLDTLGSSSSGLGLGDGTYGASFRAQDLVNYITGLTNQSFCDPNIQSSLLPNAQGLPNTFLAKNAFGALISRELVALSGLCAQSVSVNSSIGNLNNFCSWYNFGNGVTYWQAMMPPDWLDIFSGTFGFNPDHHNLYFQVKQGQTYRGTTFTYALGEYVVSSTTFTAGYIVDDTKYSGGFAYAQWTGGAGSGVCSITVQGLDQDGNNETWVLSGTWNDSNFQATQAGSQLTPQTNAYSLITKVTSIVTTGLSAAMMYIEARPPAGRTYPTT